MKHGIWMGYVCVYIYVCVCVRIYQKIIYIICIYIYEWDDIIQNYTKLSILENWWFRKIYSNHSLSKFHQASFGFIFVHVCQLKLGSFISFINTNSRGVNKEIVSIANIGIHRKTQDLCWSVHQVQPFQCSTAKLPPSWSSRVQDGSWLQSLAVAQLSRNGGSRGVQGV